MNIVKMFSVFVILSTVGILYERYNRKYFPDEELDKYDLVKKYLLNEDDRIKKKPFLWIHTKHEINSREWLSFYSRNSKNLNQPYLNLCIESIIKYCGKSFNVCLIDDDSFGNLLDDWNIDMNALSDPIKSRLRLLGKMKLLKQYGGMMAPNSMIMMKNLKSLYTKKMGCKEIFFGEMRNKSFTNDKIKYIPSTEFMGCSRNNKLMDEVISFYEKLISVDNTNESEFIGKLNLMLYKKCSNNEACLINGTQIGIKTKDNKEVLVDDLMQDGHIDFDEEMYCVYLPEEEIKRRTKYNWFLKLDKEDIFTSNTVAGKYLLISHGY